MQRAGALHRLQGVDGKVDDQLDDFNGMDPEAQRRVAHIDGQFNAVIRRMGADESRGVIEQLVYLDDFLFALLGAGEIQKAFGDFLAAFDLALDGGQSFLDDLRRALIRVSQRGQVAPEQLGVTGNDGKWIVDLVDDAGGEHARGNGAVAVSERLSEFLVCVAGGRCIFPATRGQRTRRMVY